ncbi:hypothetical protein [Enterovirga sp.]|uniref:hypothetical protein n=1 Tax=Enterovirga sp. TaxID=2026350 RepID=UPI002BD2D2DD|nr:hypothetical protein [Enterovirga sp.]HMO27895.1 hypothetical protein [Enterovirga sp.]
MQLRELGLIAGAVSVICCSSWPAAAAMPKRIGECVRTSIQSIGTRFSDKLVKPSSPGTDEGTSVVLRNGVVGISYQFVPEVGASRIGDRVITCLVSLPQDCPKGDERGKIYKTTNLRTHGSWQLPDSQHLCGGA